MWQGLRAFTRIFGGSRRRDGELAVAGGPLPDAALLLGGVWRGVFSEFGADVYIRSTLSSVATDAKGDQIFTISQKYSEQSKAGASSSHAAKDGSRLYMYETGQGEQKFDNTLGALQSIVFTIGGKATAQPPGSASPVRTITTTTITMQLIPPSLPVPST